VTTSLQKVWRAARGQDWNVSIHGAVHLSAAKNGTRVDVYFTQSGSIRSVMVEHYDDRRNHYRRIAGGVPAVERFLGGDLKFEDLP
jgi:hypothetical protein